MTSQLNKIIIPGELDSFIEFRNCTHLPEDISRLFTELKIQYLDIEEVWIRVDCASRLYGYLLPRHNIIFKLHEQKTEFDYSDEKPIATPTENKSIKADQTAKSNSLFEDIEKDIIGDTVSEVQQEISELCNLNCEDWEKALEYIESKYNVKDFDIKEIYCFVTSSEFHKTYNRLYASVCEEAAFVSLIRNSEINNLFDITLPVSGMENYAVDYGDFIIYFHYDNVNGGYENIRFNHYRYNNGKHEMFFFDATNNNLLIPYEEWQTRIESKPVIVYGKYDLSDIPGLARYDTEPPMIFLGCHECDTASDTEGNLALELCYTYDFPV